MKLEWLIDDAYRITRTELETFTMCIMGGCGRRALFVLSMDGPVACETLVCLRHSRIALSIASGETAGRLAVVSPSESDPLEFHMEYESFDVAWQLAKQRSLSLLADLQRRGAR